MNINIDDEKLQKLHWTHLKKVVEANGAHYDGFESKDEAELYVMEQTEFTDEAIALLEKYSLVSVAVAVAVEEAANIVSTDESTYKAETEASVNDAPVPETEAPKVDAPAVEAKAKAEAEAEPETEATAKADSDTPVFDPNRPHGKVAGLCAARFYQNGHHFGGDYRFIPASELE